MYARLPHACVYMHIYAEISPPAVRKVILVSACQRSLATPESFQVCECKIRHKKTATEVKFHRRKGFVRSA